MKLLSSLLIVSAVLMLQSCSKNEEIFVPYTDSGQIDNLLNKVDDQSETFIFDPSLENQIVTKNNVVVEIPANIFIDNKGVTVNEQLKLTVKDIRSSFQTLLTRSSMKVGSNSFKANSVFNVEVSSTDNEIVEIELGKRMTLYIPVEKTQLIQNARLFYGEEDEEKQVQWNSTEQSTSQHNLALKEWQLNTGVGSIFGEGYIYDLWEYGWYSVGSVISESDYSMIEMCLDLPEIFNNDNTKVFFIHKNLISIVHLQPSEGATNSFCGIISYKEDSEDEYVIISLSTTEKGDYYLGLLEEPDFSSSRLKLTPRKSSIDMIQNLLASR